MRFFEFKSDQNISEVNMSPTFLKQWGSSKSAKEALMGFEFEMVVPNIGNNKDGDLEPDYDQDTRVKGIESIFNFFDNDEFNVYLNRRQKETIEQEFYEWLDDSFSNYMDDNQAEFMERLSDTILDEILEVSDYLDDAAEELQNENRDFDITETEIIERAKQLMKNYADHCVENRTSECHAVRDDVWDEMRNDFDDRHDDQDWLEDIGITYMTDAERRWNLSWPHYSYLGTGSVSKDDIADSFSYSIGVNVNLGRDYHSATREPGKWIIEPDSSIDPDDDEDGGLEIISPAEPIATSLDNMRKVWDWAKELGCYTNSSTGLHINISVPNFSRENLDYVKLAIFSGDNYVLTQFKRFANQYARSAMGKIIDQTSPETAGAVLDAMRTKLNTETSSLVHRTYTDKYTSINVKNGWVEFRGPGGDYLSKTPDEITNTALRLAMALQIACNPTAYRQEYAKKLYTLMMSVKDAENDKPDFSYWFLLYNMGKISKADLIKKVTELRQGKTPDTGGQSQATSTNYNTDFRPPSRIPVSNGTPFTRQRTSQDQEEFEVRNDRYGDRIPMTVYGYDQYDIQDWFDRNISYPVTVTAA